MHARDLVEVLLEDRSFPSVKSFRDYHDIYAANDRLEPGKLCKEIAFDGRYWALFYEQGNKPSSDQICAMLVRSGFKADPENDGLNPRWLRSKLRSRRQSR